MFWRNGKECSNHKYVVIINILICQNIWLDTKTIFLQGGPEKNKTKLFKVIYPQA